MTKLIVESIETGGVSFGPPVPFPSLKAHNAWNSIVPQILTYAFVNRAAWFINVQPQEWSLGRELTNSPAVRVAGKEYLLIFKDLCTDILLRDIAESQDFKLGLFWLASLGIDRYQQVEQIIRAVEASAFFTRTPQLSCELLLGAFDYAETIYWFNPSRSLVEICDELFKLSRFVGWEFESPFS